MNVGTKVQKLMIESAVGHCALLPRQRYVCKLLIIVHIIVVVIQLDVH
jgi:hypothetical protein